jgi:hypothetical protein
LLAQIAARSGMNRDDRGNYVFHWTPPIPHCFNIPICYAGAVCVNPD